MYKIGMIGTSLIAQKFVTATKLNNQVELYMIYSREIKKAKEFKNKHGFNMATNNLDELMNSAADFIYIATPNEIHYEQVKMALLAKKNVIVEKPITISYEQTKELYAIAENNDVVLIEAVKTVAMNTYKYLKENLKQLGTITSMELNINRCYENYPKKDDQKMANIYRRDMDGGVLNDLGSYALYPVADLTNDDFAISTETFTENYLDVETDLQSSLSAKTNELTIKISLSMKNQGENQSIITGENGIMIIDSLSQFNQVLHYDNDHELIAEINADHSHMMEGELIEMINCLDNQSNKSSIYTRELALRCQEIMQAIRLQLN